MDQQTLSDQLITQYLLGSLSSEETERLDELSLSDDEFAVRLQAVENELIDAYVEGEPFRSDAAAVQFILSVLAEKMRKGKIRPGPPHSRRTRCRQRRGNERAAGRHGASGFANVRFPSGVRFAGSV